MRQLLAVLLFAACALVGFSMYTPVASGQEKPAAAAKSIRWDGHIVRIDEQNMYMDVRDKSGQSRRIHWDSSTLWTKLNKKVSDHSEFKEEERVICLGTVDKKGEYTATRIDLRVHP